MGPTAPQSSDGHRFISHSRGLDKGQPWAPPPPRHHPITAIPEIFAEDFVRQPSTPHSTLRRLRSFNMSLRIPNFYHQLPLPPPQRKVTPLYHRRGWKRRKLKQSRSPLTAVSLTIRSNFDFNFFDSSPFENLFRSLISQFPSVNSIDVFAPALGLASGAAVYFSQSGGNSKFISNYKRQGSCCVGEWILDTSPTPFNRFVILRCPSITFEGSELLEDVNDKLVKQDRHFVRVNKGGIVLRDGEMEEEIKKLVYQRSCIGTEDGGVIALDWPVNLDLEEERGLDSTVLIVPGNVEGSMDMEIKAFVCECLRRGYFPVVMNPRGCAGSPLTTPRLFTAADSDDISTAIQFVNKARPWTTMMSVGWGYGANMLTKYLAEVGERTPLTAATCIDNPFDLDETTRSTPHHILLDQKLKTGLIGILSSNKELFQGRAKGFDVDKALLATSVREFEKEVSMVSYGFNEIEDFYAEFSTRHMVGKVKIPLLFIQNDNGIVPLFSTPRSLIAENPYTSLLLCSYSPSREFTSGRSTFSWCQEITIEWLTAVELGLLKGRHPLLTDVDVTINPSKGLPMLESRSSDKNGKANRLLTSPKFDALDAHSINNVKHSMNGSYVEPFFPSKSKQELKGPPKEITVPLDNREPVEGKPGKEEVVDLIDSETGDVQQTAKVVIKMLDVTIPGTLTEEQKKKVLAAVGQGESIVKALQDAVPEDVRGNITTAVSGILRSQESTLRMGKILRLGRNPEATSNPEPKVPEQDGLSNPNSKNQDTPSSVQTQETDLAGAQKSQPTKDKATEESESELQASEQKSADSGELKTTSADKESDTPELDKKDTNDLISSKDTAYASEERNGLVSDSKENESAQPDLLSKPEASGVSEDKSCEQYKDLDSEKSDIKAENTGQQNDVKPVETSVDETKNTSSGQTDSSPVSVPESQPVEKEGEDSVRSEENRTIVSSVDDSKLPSFDVSQALNAFTGIDDSTQMAVNSVFSVIEGVITQLEEGRVDATQAENVAKNNEDRGASIGNDSGARVAVEVQKIDSNSDKHISRDDCRLEKVEDEKSYMDLPSDTSRDVNIFNQTNLEGEFARESSVFSDRSRSFMYEENGKMKDMLSRKLSAQSPAKLMNSMCQPGTLSITTNLYVDPLYREYLQRYLMTKMKIAESLDMDSTLFLDYSPEEGKWKLLEMSEGDNIIGDDVVSGGEVDPVIQTRLEAKRENTDDIIEPSYVILDSEVQGEQGGECEKAINTGKEIDDDTSEEILLFIKSIILDTLKVEVDRRVSFDDIKQMQPKLSKDMDVVANAVWQSLRHQDQPFFHRTKDDTSHKLGFLEGKQLVNALSSAVGETIYLRKVLPVGIIVGSSLASLRQYFSVSVVSTNIKKEGVNTDFTQQTKADADKLYSETTEQKRDLDLPKKQRETDTSSSNGNNLMVGAMSAALGASALLVDQQNYGTTQALSKPLEEDGTDFKGHKNEEIQSSIVTSLAEKALSVASPVVPTKEDGGVDQERIVTMLAELGQRGGILRLVGKVALLWGGIRGALSLINKLITFLRLAERPLSHRISGFAFMVIVLWSPVVIPLLPTLVQGWANHSPHRIAELACIVGLYVSVVLMVTLWGKRIRGFEKPLEQYGVDLTSLPKVQNFAKGLVGGVALVSVVNCVNMFCGFVQLSVPSYFLASSPSGFSWLKLSGRTLLLLIQGVATATAIAVVEELLFRAWLPDEIATDFGYYRGVIISGLVFSLSQRSLWAIPGLWLLSVALAGARQRSQGSLSLPIGLHAGILASSFMLQRGGFLTYNPSTPVWLCGSCHFEPFSGLIGLGFSVLLALSLYPRQPSTAMEETRIVKSE